MAAMTRRGVSTFNARTAYETSRPLPNLASVLTGRQVRRSQGGHAVTSSKVRGTVHRGAGGYVQSVFDMAHDNGLGTTLYTATSAGSALRPSWGARHGRPDPYGVDNGRNKISRFRQFSTDRQVVNAFKAHRTRPTAYTHLHLGGPMKAGVAHRFGSRAYRDAVQRFDRDLRVVRRSIHRSPQLRGRTLLVVVSTGGGSGRSVTPASAPANFRVPMLIEGPGAAAGRDLYSVNPAWQVPGAGRTGYSGRAIHTGVTANLALAALRLPALPGSVLNTTQSFGHVPWP